MEALGINLGLLIVQLIAFAIVFLTLNAWVYKPMLDMMESRKTKLRRVSKTPVSPPKPGPMRKKKPPRFSLKRRLKLAKLYVKLLNAPPPLARM